MPLSLPDPGTLGAMSFDQSSKDRAGLQAQFGLPHADTSKSKNHTMSTSPEHSTEMASKILNYKHTNLLRGCVCVLNHIQLCLFGSSCTIRPFT